MNSGDYQVSSNTNTPSGASACMDMTTSINGGAQQDMDYAVIATYLDPQYAQSYLPLPALTYTSTGGTMNYICGVLPSNTFCCC